MAGRQPTPPALTRDREVLAWDRACAGKTHAAIAAELGITRSAVSHMLARIAKRALKALERSVEQQKSLQTARLEHIYSEAMAGWESSKQPRKRSSNRKTLEPGAPARGKGKKAAAILAKEETRVEATTTDGNVAFLQAGLAALGDLRKMWGLDAPKKVDVLDQRRPLEQLTDEELQRRAAENAALLAAEGDGA